MYNGLEHVWQAVEILVGLDEPLKARLEKAAAEFSVALIQTDEWPEDLLPNAIALDAKLKNIPPMTVEMARSAAKGLVDLSVEVQIAIREADSSGSR